MRRKIVAGNWKMNVDLQDGLQLVDGITQAATSPTIHKIIIPPFTHLFSIANRIKSHQDFSVGAQNCHHQKNGAFTGEVSADMVSSTGARYVIVGHSERRLLFGETTQMLIQKLAIALENNLTPIFCLGENIEERNANQHLEAVKKQLKEGLFHLSPADMNKIIVAYEPVWAIGTGLTATCHQAQGMHHFIRSELNKKFGKEISDNISILYGGSCNPQNAKELFACLDVDGGLIGGASLKADEFVAIVNSF